MIPMMMNVKNQNIVAKTNFCLNFIMNRMAKPRTISQARWSALQLLECDMGVTSSLEPPLKELILNCIRMKSLVKYSLWIIGCSLSINNNITLQWRSEKTVHNDTDHISLHNDIIFPSKNGAYYNTRDQFRLSFRRCLSSTHFFQNQ